MSDLADVLLPIGKSLLQLGAPIIGAAIGGPFGAIAGKFLADAVGAPDASPASINEAWQKLDPAAQAAAAAKAEEAYAAALTEEAKTAGIVATQIGETSRAEVGSEDAYVRRGRPSILYAFAFLSVLFGIVFALAAAVIVYRFDAAGIATAFAAMSSLMFAVGAFLGVVMVPVTGYVKSRGQEKQAAITGERAPGALESLGKLFGKK